jgi:CMP-N-acetylneuraminic acid synthetase
VVPARGGSKGIPLKNIQTVRGIPMIARVAKLLSGLDFIDYALVSTDSEQIIAVAAEFGLQAPFRRPKNLSGDAVSDYQVLIHALVESEYINEVKYDLVIMLQPTSPLRRAHHIVEALDHFINGNYDAVWSVSMSDPKNHPLKQLVVDGETLDYYDEAGSSIVARQQLEPLFQRNGIVYVISRACLLDHGTIKGDCTGAYVVSEPSISIDTTDDIDYVEFLMGKYGDPLELDKMN